MAPDFNALLGPVGLRLAEPQTRKAAAGWSGGASEGGIKLSTVEKGSAAWNAGFGPEDLLVAIDGQRMSQGRFDTILSERKPGDQVTVSFFRRDQLMTKTLTLGSAPAVPAKVVPVEGATAAQKALFSRWLLVPYPKG
jgi:predicted metalloprotease with PDZ domain